MHLVKNIKRWVKLDIRFQYIFEYENYKLLSVSRNTNKNYDYIFVEYINFVESNDIKHINNIFSFSIQNKYMSVIDIFVKKINLNDYLKKNTVMEISQLEKISSKKLYKYFVNDL